MHKHRSGRLAVVALAQDKRVSGPSGSLAVTLHDSAVGFRFSSAPAGGLCTFMLSTL